MERANGGSNMDKLYEAIVRVVDKERKGKEYQLGRMHEETYI